MHIPSYVPACCACCSTDSVGDVKLRSRIKFGRIFQSYTYVVSNSNVAGYIFQANWHVPCSIGGYYTIRGRWRAPPLLAPWSIFQRLFHDFGSPHWQGHIKNLIYFHMSFLFLIVIIPYGVITITHSHFPVFLSLSSCCFSISSIPPSSPESWKTLGMTLPIHGRTFPSGASYLRQCNRSFFKRRSSIFKDLFVDVILRLRRSFFAKKIFWRSSCVGCWCWMID